MKRDISSLLKDHLAPGEKILHTEQCRRAPLFYLPGVFSAIVLPILIFGALIYTLLDLWTSEIVADQYAAVKHIILAVLIAIIAVYTVIQLDSLIWSLAKNTLILTDKALYIALGKGYVIQKIKYSESGLEFTLAGRRLTIKTYPSEMILRQGRRKKFYSAVFAYAWEVIASKKRSVRIIPLVFTPLRVALRYRGIKFLYIYKNVALKDRVKTEQKLLTVREECKKLHGEDEFPEILAYDYSSLRDRIKKFIDGE